MQAKVIDTLVTLLTSSCDVQGQSVLPPSDVQVCEAGVVSSCVRSEHHGYLEGRRRRRGDKEKEQGIGSERAGNNKIEPKKKKEIKYNPAGTKCSVRTRTYLHLRVRPYRATDRRDVEDVVYELHGIVL